MKVHAILRNYRATPRKVRLLIPVLKGQQVENAVGQLDRSSKRSASQIKKLLLSAVANAENNFGLDRKNLFVESMVVDEGTRLKRWLPRAFGRATPIWKRNSHVKIVLEETVPGLKKKAAKKATTDTTRKTSKKITEAATTKKKAVAAPRKKKVQEGVVSGKKTVSDNKAK